METESIKSRLMNPCGVPDVTKHNLLRFPHVADPKTSDTKDPTPKGCFNLFGDASIADDTGEVAVLGFTRPMSRLSRVPDL